VGAELLAEEATEKEAATIKKGKGKKKKQAKAARPAATADLAEADALASTTRPAVAEEGLPEGVGRAAFQGDARAVAAWLDEGGGVDAHYAVPGGATLLIEAATAGQEAMVRMLLQRGASINLQDSLDGTALMGAAGSGHTTVVQALLDAKADASLQSVRTATRRS
jgi:hypothetical protein